jgi:hypothetical protein
VLLLLLPPAAADMVNFEVKKRMYRRFSTGFGVFMIAQLCECLLGGLEAGGRHLSVDV